MGWYGKQKLQPLLPWSSGPLGSGPVVLWSCGPLAAPDSGPARFCKLSGRELVNLSAFHSNFPSGQSGPFAQQHGEPWPYVGKWRGSFSNQWVRERDFPRETCVCWLPAAKWCCPWAWRACPKSIAAILWRRSCCLTTYVFVDLVKEPPTDCNVMCTDPIEEGRADHSACRCGLLQSRRSLEGAQQGWRGLLLARFAHLLGSPTSARETCWLVVLQRSPSWSRVRSSENRRANNRVACSQKGM